MKQIILGLSVAHALRLNVFQKQKPKVYSADYYESFDNTALELQDQETLDEFQLQERKTNEEKEQEAEDDEDLQLCSQLDFGDPIEDYEKGDAPNDLVDKSEKQKEIEKKCLLHKKKISPVDNTLMQQAQEEKKEDDKAKQQFRMMLVADESAKQKEHEKAEEIKKQLAEKALAKKRAEEEQKRKDIKKNAEEKIKIAEQVKIKAIAEAEQAKKDYFDLVQPKKLAPKNKVQAKHINGTTTKSLAQKQSKKQLKKVQKIEIKDEKKDKEVEANLVSIVDDSNLMRAVHDNKLAQLSEEIEDSNKDNIMNVQTNAAIDQLLTEVGM